MSEKGRKISKFSIQQAVPLVRRGEQHPRRDEGVRRDEGTLHRDEPKELKDASYRFVTTKLPSSR